MNAINTTISYAKVAEYECLQCEKRYVQKWGKLICESCGASDVSDFVIIYQRNDSVVESMFNRSDIIGG